MKTWTKDEDAQLITMVAEGNSFSQITRIMSVRSRNSLIARHNRLRGVKFPGDVVRKQRQHVLACERQLERQRKRAARASRAKQTFLSLSDRNAAICAARAGGATFKEIGELAGVTPERIRQIINRLDSGSQTHICVQVAPP